MDKRIWISCCRYPTHFQYSPNGYGGTYNYQVPVEGQYAVPGVNMVQQADDIDLGMCADQNGKRCVFPSLSWPKMSRTERGMSFIDTLLHVCAIYCVLVFGF